MQFLLYYKLIVWYVIKLVSSSISEYMIGVDKERRHFADWLRSSDPELINQIPQPDISSLKVCGVDGGFIKKEYHGIGLILRRAVAVCFEYKNQKLTVTKYLPSKNPIVEEMIIGPEFSEQEFSSEANLRRVEIELETAISAVKKFKPDLLVLDGSVLIYPSSLPEKCSKAYPTYKKVLNLYKELYTTCKSSEIILAGAIEDSRGKRFCNILKEKLPKGTKTDVLETITDTLLLHYLLKKGERTSIFKYSDEGELPFLKDIGKDWSENIYVTYLKSSEFDRPMRVEFLVYSNPEKYAEKTACILNWISSYSRYYCYPSVLIEADARAKLTENDVSMFKQKILDSVGYNPALFDLRRETRPF